MSLQFITGASGSGKSTYIDQQIIARSEREPEGRFFILVPDQFTMQTQKDLVSLHDRKGIMNIDVLSFGRLTHRIFEEMGANRLPMLDDTGKSLIIRRVAAGQKGELPVLGGRLGQTGYIHEVKSAISEFMQYGIGLQELDQLTEFSKKRGQLYYKLKDLRTIYEGFQQFIREKYLTTEESLEVLASYVPLYAGTEPGHRRADEAGKRSDRHSYPRKWGKSMGGNPGAGAFFHEQKDDTDACKACTGCRNSHRGRR